MRRLITMKRMKEGFVAVFTTPGTLADHGTAGELSSVTVTVKNP
jgi:hypothetical protein